MKAHQLGPLIAKSRTVNDNFQRTIASGGFGVANTGQPWVALQNSSAQYVDPSLGASVTSAATFAVAVVDTAASDVDISLTYSGMSGTAQGVILRAVDISNLYYVRIGTASTAILSRAAGSFTQRAAFSTATVAGDLMRVVITSSKIDVYKNGSLILTWTDPDNLYLESTRHGVSLSNAASHVRKITFTPLNNAQSISRDITFASQFQNDDLSQYAVIFHKETISFHNDPLGGSKRVIKLSVPDTATGPTENVRCQLQPPANILPDIDLWCSLAVMFPSGTGPTAGDVPFPSMPTTGTSGWYNICQLYQSNPESSAAVKLGFRIAGGDRLYWQRNETYGSDRPWMGDLIERDKWYEFAWHMYTSADETIGFAELWMNQGSGWQQQTFFPGTPQQSNRLYMKTLDPIATTNGPNRFDIQAYRKVGMFPQTVEHYFGPQRIGYSLATVDPGMY